MLYSTSSMRWHILSSRRGGSLVVECNGSRCPSRYASIRTLSVSHPLFGGSVQIMSSVLIRLISRYCNLPSSFSSWRENQVHLAQSPRSTPSVRRADNISDNCCSGNLGGIFALR
jgi:hypothetical protein